MSIKFNKSGYNRAVEIIDNGLEVEHDTNNWEEVKPTVDEELQYIDTHSLDEYGEWFLGIRSEPELKDDIKKFVYPFGDFKVLHKSALLSSKKLAEKNKDNEIAGKIDELLDMI